MLQKLILYILYCVPFDVALTFPIGNKILQWKQGNQCAKVSMLPSYVVSAREIYSMSVFVLVVTMK